MEIELLNAVNKLEDRIQENFNNSSNGIDKFLEITANTLDIFAPRIKNTDGETIYLS